MEILAALDRERAADVLEEMDPDDAADLLAELPQPEQDVLLDLMEPDEADPVRAAAELHAGHRRQRDDLRAGRSCRRTRRWPRRWPGSASRSSPRRSPPQVFVTRAPMATPTGRYLGMVHFQRLLREPPADCSAAWSTTTSTRCEPDTPLPEITRRMATYDLVGMPVVDDNNRLVGAVTVDDVLDHSLPRDWRDRDHNEPLQLNGGVRG